VGRLRVQGPYPYFPTSMMSWRGGDPAYFAWIITAMQAIDS
jgi:hypothetical protein